MQPFIERLVALGESRRSALLMLFLCAQDLQPGQPVGPVQANPLASSMARISDSYHSRKIAKMH